MTNQELYELMDRFERSSLQALKLTRGDVSLELEKGAVTAAAAVPAVVAASPVQEVQPEDPAITAPLVGTFYAASAPGAEPYVTVGSRVKQGQTVCLMEAMKMISEIPAPCDCRITEILKDDGTLAAFGEPLLRYQPC